MLVVLDDALETVRVREAAAALEVAWKAEAQARAKAMATVASARANCQLLATAIADVKNRIAALRVAVARWNEARAAAELARVGAERYAEFAKRKAVTQEQADVRVAGLAQNQARVVQALEEIQGTGATMAVLPPQNATGNFVKIIQRLPVRIDLLGDNPPDTPLDAGLSAVPHVRVHEPPTGRHAGQKRRGSFPRKTDTAAARPAGSVGGQ